MNDRKLALEMLRIMYSGKCVNDAKELTDDYFKILENIRNYTGQESLTRIENIINIYDMKFEVSSFDARNTISRIRDVVRGDLND